MYFSWVEAFDSHVKPEATVRLMINHNPAKNEEPAIPFI